MKKRRLVLKQLAKDNEAGYDSLVAQTTELERRRVIINDIVTRESAAAVTAAQRQTTYTQNLVNASVFEKSILDINLKKANIQDKINKKQDENKDLLALTGEDSGEVKGLATRSLHNTCI